MSTLSSASTRKDTFPFDQKIVWRPDPEIVAESNLQAFMLNHGMASYEELMARSTQDIAWFWDAALQDLDIQFYEPYEQVVDLSQGLASPRWCVGGKMNIIHNCLDKWQATEAREYVALKYEREDGLVRTFTYGQLHEEVCRCANALRWLGLGKGDVVGLYMPMTPELCIAFLAVIKIGGIILPLFSGYGPGALATRLNDAGAKALFTADGYHRRGQPVPMKQTADEALAQCPSVEHVIVQRCLETDQAPMQPGRDYWWHELIPGHSDEAETEHTEAEDVLMVIYTSGTTGRPKGAVHTHCGFPVKGAQDMYHAMDLKPQECMFWLTDMGWMMGPWLVFGTLCIGASMVFFDGAPDYPDVDRLWHLAEKHQVTHLGVSPVLIRALMPHGPDPIQQHDLSSLRAVGSTGSPWDPDSWQWCFENVLESQKPILNYCGGTEISGGYICGNFLKPLKPCAFSGPVPGMDVEVVDAEGNPVRQEVGEVVIRKPWIGMTRGFWQDPQRYLETYWSRFENVWVHGDFAAIDEDGLWFILGRSDDTIKVAGKRLGPAEVEALVNAHEAVAESAAIGIPHPVKGEELAVFVVLSPGVVPSDVLKKDLIRRITDELGKPLKPREIRFANALPKTRNAKVMRRLIRAVYLGADPGDVSSLENPATLDAIREAR